MFVFLGKQTTVMINDETFHETPAKTISFYKNIQKNKTTMAKRKVQIFYIISVLSLFSACIYFLNRRTHHLDIRKNMVLENDEDKLKSEEKETDKKQWRENSLTAPEKNEAHEEQDSENKKTKNQINLGDSFNDKDPKENIDNFMSSMDKMNFEDMKNYLPQGSMGSTGNGIPNLVALPGKFNTGFDDEQNQNSKSLEDQIAAQMSPEFRRNLNQSEEKKIPEFHSDLQDSLARINSSFEDIERQRNENAKKSQQNDLLAADKGIFIPTAQELENKKDLSFANNFSVNKSDSQKPTENVESTPNDLTRKTSSTKDDEKMKTSTKIVDKSDKKKHSESSLPFDENETDQNKIHDALFGEKTLTKKNNKAGNDRNILPLPQPFEKEKSLTTETSSKQPSSDNLMKGSDELPSQIKKQSSVLPESEMAEKETMKKISKHVPTVLQQTIKVSIKSPEKKHSEKEIAEKKNESRKSEASIKIVSEIPGKHKNKANVLSDNHQIEKTNTDLLTDGGIIKPENTIPNEDITPSKVESSTDKSHNLSNAEKISQKYTESTPIFRDLPVSEGVSEKSSEKVSEKTNKESEIVPVKHSKKKAHKNAHSPNSNKKSRNQKIHIRPRNKNQLRKNIVPIIKFKENEEQVSETKNNHKSENEVKNHKEPKIELINIAPEKMIQNEAEKNHTFTIDFIPYNNPVKPKPSFNQQSSFQDESTTDSLETDSDADSDEDVIYDIDEKSRASKLETADRSEKLPLTQQ